MPSSPESANSISVPVDNVLTLEQKRYFITDGSLTEEQEAAITLTILEFARKLTSSEIPDGKTIIGIGGWSINPLATMSITIHLLFSE